MVTQVFPIDRVEELGAKRSPLSQTIRYDGFDNRDGGNFVKFLTRRYNETSDGVDESLLFSDVNSTHTRLTAIKACFFNIVTTCESTSTIVIRVDKFDSDDNYLEGNQVEQNTGYHAGNPSAIMKMDVGDYIKIYANQTIINGTQNAVLQVLAMPLDVTPV